MLTVNNQPIESLTALNEALTSLHPIAGTATHPLDAAMFAVPGNPTGEEIDQAIVNYKKAVYDYFEIDEEVGAIKKELIAIVADPDGYKLETDAGLSAYINTGNYALEDQSRKLLVSAANNSGSSRHQTSNAQGNPNGADAYIHAYALNQIHGFTDDGTHRGFPKVTVVSYGDVSGDGVHRFSR